MVVAAGVTERMLNWDFEVTERLCNGLSVEEGSYSELELLVVVYSGATNELSSGVSAGAANGVWEAVPANNVWAAVSVGTANEV